MKAKNLPIFQYMKNELYPLVSGNHSCSFCSWIRHAVGFPLDLGDFQKSGRTAHARSRRVLSNHKCFHESLTPRSNFAEPGTQFKLIICSVQVTTDSGVNINVISH